MNEDIETRFRELYEATSGRVYAFLRRHSDPDLAETVTAEVFVKAWRNFETMGPEPLGWLITTARRTLIDHQRSRGRRARLTEQVYVMERSASEPSPETTVTERRAVLEALEQLSETDREALLLIGWDGLTHEMAAEVLGVSRPSFTKRLGRARQRLEELLDPTAPARPIPLRRIS
ncbi:MAG: RNA polymerase sigma factor [Propionibacteriaceae bacterium]|nr:RNA polymerase sigma factor [Propionibacteriaceae bacterium]